MQFTPASTVHVINLTVHTCKYNMYVSYICTFRTINPYRARNKYVAILINFQIYNDKNKEILILWGSWKVLLSVYSLYLRYISILQHRTLFRKPAVRKKWVWKFQFQAQYCSINLIYLHKYSGVIYPFECIHISVRNLNKVMNM